MILKFEINKTGLYLVLSMDGKELNDWIKVFAGVITVRFEGLQPSNAKDVIQAAAAASQQTSLIISGVK